MNILFLSRWFPYPPDNGSRIRVFNLIKHLALHHRVDLISFASGPVADEQIKALGNYCQLVKIVRHRPFHPGRLTALMGFFSPRPRSVIDTYSAEMLRQVEGVGRDRSPDLVIASQLDMAPYAMALPTVPKILEEVELTVLHEKYVGQRHPLKRLRTWLMWQKSARYVAGLLRAFDGCTVVSEQERGQVLRVFPGYDRVSIVPNGVDTTYYAADFGAPESDRLVYSGSLTYSANFDAMSFFLREVFPLIQTQRSNAKLSITGRLDGAPVDRLPYNQDVAFTGYLDDVRPTVGRSWSSVVPLRIGGGTRLKILESLALGTPVVSTRKGAEGLDLEAGRDILVADEPADFAAVTVRLLQDHELRTRLSHNGRQAVNAKYDWQIIGQRLNDLIEAVIRRKNAETPLNSQTASRVSPAH
jgi:glycosyltransferase involved in cell wall biosynthesis